MADKVKIKALRNCRGGGIALEAGEVYSLHEATARKLIKLGKAAPADDQQQLEVRDAAPTATTPTAKKTAKKTTGKKAKE